MHKISIRIQQYITGCTSLLFLVLVLLTPQAYAQSGSAIAQGFQANTANLGTGALVSLISTGQPMITSATTTNVKNLVGVMSNQPLVELSNNSKANAQVVVSGSTQALVSDLNGIVKVGDKITASPVAGIGMKAINSTEIVGIAQADLSSVKTTKQTVARQDGKTVEINVGLVPVAVNVSYYSVPQGQQPLSSLLPPFLEKLANGVSGRQVSPLRVLVSALSLVLGFLAAAIMLYASIRSSIVSIGRNPLARESLRRGFMDVVIAAIGVLVVSIAATYIILIG